MNLPRFTPRHITAAGAWSGFIGLVIIAALVALPFWIWFFCRIEPGANQIAVLIRKTGSDLPSGQILALEPGQKGIQLEVLLPGRYFYNPYTWSWRVVPITDVPGGKLGVLTRLYGQDLPDGQILAADPVNTPASQQHKGIIADVLSPGRHAINPYAYDIQLFDAITIPPGSVGVVTSLVGKDMLSSPGIVSKAPTTQESAAGAENGLFTVPRNFKGVLAGTLSPGTYYLNPYMVTVVDVNLQSRRFEMAGEDAISFLTADGFTVHVEGTIEWSVQPEMAAELTHRVGDLEDILKKVILPRARGFSRIEGSKSPATSYIVGETRQQFQDHLQQHLVDRCKIWGVLVKSVLVRNISPPDQIASIIRDREVAVQDARKFEQQIEQARSQAELTKQEMLAEQSKVKVQSDTAKIRAVIQAKQDMAVKLLAASKDREVAKLETEAAVAQAEAIRFKAKGEQDVIRLRNEAEAAVIASQIRAFSSGMNLARYEMYQRIAPKIGSILSGDDPSGLGAWIRAFAPPPPGNVPGGTLPGGKAVQP
ncbi:MAG: hypothetical protein IT440_06745 [Phycisphaeraceae bacterium]|nr:hypothetical protein [Phycisphaeraceae bacterium]